MISIYPSMVDGEKNKNKIVFIYENYYSFMAYTAGEILNHSKHDVEDVVHSAILKIIENIDVVDITDVNKVKNLCGVIARNKAIDFLRAKKNQVLSLDDDNVFAEISGSDTDPGELLVNIEAYDIILEEIRKLPDIYRDVCLLKYVNSMKEKEIAALLGLTESAVGVRIYRAKQILKEALRKENIDV